MMFENTSYSNAFTGGFPSFKQHQAFTPDSQAPQEIAPSLWLGSYECLQDQFLVNTNVKIIINCGNTGAFLDKINAASVSSDVIILSLDPSFSLNNASNNELFTDFIATHNKILQNYINHFYIYNPNAKNLVHELPSTKLDFSSPILTGNLKAQFFNLLRLISLCKSINNSIQVLVVSEKASSLATGLAIAYLMDTYNYNVQASLQTIQARAPHHAAELNHNFYDDLLIIENLKKFGQENNSLKQKNPGVLMANCRLKRRGRDDEDDTEMDNMIMPTPTHRKRRYFR